MAGKTRKPFLEAVRKRVLESNPKARKTRKPRKLAKQDFGKTNEVKDGRPKRAVAAKGSIRKDKAIRKPRKNQKDGRRNGTKNRGQQRAAVAMRKVKPIRRPVPASGGVKKPRR